MSPLKNIQARMMAAWRSGSTGALLFLVLLLISTPLTAQESVSKEEQVKALFLYNFTQFVQWPEEAFAADDAPLVIGILGKDPFGRFIDELVRGEVIDGHPIRVERFNTVDDLETTHILYVTSKDAIEPLLEGLRSQPVLTVSDQNDFARRGGMIRFYTENGRIRIRINLEAVSGSQLIISSKLLRLSDVIGEKSN